MNHSHKWPEISDMQNYHIRHTDPPALLRQLQDLTLNTLMPNRKLLFRLKPNFFAKKYETNEHLTKLVTNTNSILSLTNKIRGWTRNGTPIAQHLFECSVDYHRLMQLTKEQFTDLPRSPRNPFHFIIETACVSLIKRLSWTQLRAKHDEIRSRDKCDLCPLRVRNTKIHSPTFKSKISTKTELDRKHHEHRQAHSRQFHAGVASCFYEFASTKLS